MFTWRPLIGQTNSTNTIKVNVTDSGMPNLSTTNNFVVRVNPISQPSLNSITLGSQPNLSATDLLGPDYTLLTSKNLVNWSDSGIFLLRRPPYNDNVGSHGAKMIAGSNGYWGQFPDVFDPSFAASVRRAMAPAP